MKHISSLHQSIVVLLLAAIVLSACAPIYYPQAAAPASAPASEPGAAWSGGEAAAPAAEAPVAAEAALAPESAMAAPGADHAGPAYALPAHPYPTPVPYGGGQQQHTPVTAGVVDDNEQWADYLDYRSRHSRLWVRDRDVSERIIVQVWDERREPVHDATVQILGGQQQVLFEGRTDAGGRLFFHPRALDANVYADRYDVVVRKGYVAQRQQMERYQANQQARDHWTFVLAEPPRAATTQLDLLFLIDATGSMSDEIDKLKRSMAEIADQIAALPERPYVRYGLVAYRDRGDAFVVRTWDFTPHLDQFQATLAQLQADGGGDTPESLNEALHRSLHEMFWTPEDAVRIVLLVADAPPHLDYQEPFSYDRDMIEAVRRGIKIFPVGASGLDAQGEYIFRQLAQFTGGKFVFLTYEEGSDPGSGPGAETTHDVENYSVDTLDRLVVRLVREELAKLPQGSRQQ